VIFQKRALRGVTEKGVSLPNVSLVTLSHVYSHEHLFALELMHLTPREAQCHASAHRTS